MGLDHAAGPAPGPHAPPSETLDLLQRLLLRCDGTLTDLIETLTGEPIGLVKIEHRVEAAPTDLAALDLHAAEPQIERRIQLQGLRSRIAYVYAETSIAAARLPAPLRRALATSATPIGRLCKQHRLEVFKEPIEVHTRRAGELAPHLGTDADTTIVFRRYRSFSRGQPLMLIREYIAPALWQLRLSALN